MRRRDEVDRLVEVITVDCYNLAEQTTAFYETFAVEVPLPTTATVVGSTIDVLGIDITDDGDELIAHCRRGAIVQELSLADLVFAPDLPAGWIHAAYRRCLGRVPYEAAVPQGWQPSWL